MKKFILMLLSVWIGVTATFSQQIIITDDASYTSPASGSMLDVKSTSKGFMPPRVALTGRTDASTITSPATGLMIYNTTNAGSSPDSIYPGYYYNSGTEGSPNWMRVTNSDVLNGMAFQSDGSPILTGNATAWNDLVVPAYAGFSASSNPPSLAAFLGTVRSLNFADVSLSNENQIFFAIQMPHDWKEGTSLYPHVHWSPQSGTTGVVVWGFEFTWQNYVAGTPATYPSPETITGTSVSVTASDNDKHFITSLPEISTTSPTNNNVTGKKISSILMCRFFRNSSNVDDTYGGDAALLSFDIHYQIDSFGSRQPFIK